ncbi:MAG TPA: J domain-containing protein [Spirochaetia bacterium]|nr:J domain-containing protein [Spirochaetia bacterium]
MDQIFDRLGNLLKSLFQNDDEDASKAWEWRGKSGDPDLDSAMDELNDFLKSDKGEASSTRTRTTGSSSGRTASGQTYRPTIPEEIRRDYGNLEVPVGADLTQVRKAYHRLIRQYHPDRFANNPSKLKEATEISQRINQSYQRIKRFRETGRI